MTRIRPNAFVVLFAALVLSYIPATVYTLFINPEVRFWSAAYHQKAAWAEKHSATGPKSVFVGGSSCAFQVDAGMLTRDYDLPSVNMGMHAGTGAPGLMAFGLSVLSPGDTLILSMEPALFTSPPDRTPLGYQMLVATGLLFRPGLHWLALEDIRVGEFLSAMRPGLQNITTMLAKVVARRPMYRYRVTDLKEGGAMSTDVRTVLGGMGAGPMIWNEESSRWLKTLTSEIKSKTENSTIYLLPLGLFQVEASAEARLANESFLANAPSPVHPIEDSALGVATNPEEFADSAQHVTVGAMTARTSDVAEILKSAIPNL